MARNDYGVSFNGRRINHPGAYDHIDATALTVTSGGSLNIPIVVGTAEGGESGKVLWFTGAEEARSVLRGGDLPIALEMMFSPAPEGGGGASLIGVVIANETTQATVTQGNLVTTAKEFGEGGNRIQVKLEDGTLAGTKKFTAYKWDSEELEVFDNLGAILKIEYTGAEAYATASVTVVDGVATTLETKIGADAGTAMPDLSVDLTNPRFATVDDVIKYLNSVSGYNVSYVDYKNAGMSTATFEAVTDLDIVAGNHIFATKGDIEYQLGQYSELVEVEVLSAPTNFDFQYLTNGVTGVAPASWSEYFDLIKKQFSDILVVLSGSESIHAEALAHVQQMEKRHQKQLLFTGGEVGETIERTKERASTLNSSRAVLAFPGIYHKAYFNGQKALPSYFTAAMLAGRVAGVAPSEPVTFDYFNLVALERELVAGDPDIDDLITSGVATLEKVQNGGIRLVQGITTYVGVDNVLYREISVRRGADVLSSTIRKAMEDAFVGKRGLRATASAVETKAIDELERAVREGNITAYRNIIVRFVGTIVYVDYEVAPVEPINFVLVTAHFVPDSVLGTEQ